MVLVDALWIEDKDSSSCLLSLLLTSAREEKTGGKENIYTARSGGEMKMRPIHRARLSTPLDTMLQSSMALPRFGACGKVANLSFFLSPHLAVTTEIHLNPTDAWCALDSPSYGTLGVSGRGQGFFAFLFVLRCSLHPLLLCHYWYAECWLRTSIPRHEAEGDHEAQQQSRLQEATRQQAAPQPVRVSPLASSQL
jgi:hypothetical protein